MRSTAKLSSKSQITIPSWARRQLEVGPGTRLTVRVEGDRIVLERADRGVAHLEGALKHLLGGDPDRAISDLRGEWAHRA